MADPYSDIDEGGDIQNDPYQQDLQDQLEARQSTPSFTPRGQGLYTPPTAPAPSQGIPARPRYQPLAPSADDKFTGNEFRVGGAPVPQEPDESAGKGSYLRDFTRQIWTSTLGMGDSALGVAKGLEDSLGADPAIKQWTDNARKSLSDHIASTLADMSPERQQAARASILRSFNIGPEYDAQGNRIPGAFEYGIHNYLGAQVANLIPQALLAFVPGSILGKVVGTAATIGGFGALNAGDVYNQIADGIDKKPDADYQRENPAYHDLRQSMGEDDAKAKMKQTIAPTVLALGAAAGAAGGAALGAGGIGSTALRRVAIGAGVGALGMGGQGAADTAISQYAEQQNQAGGRQGYDTSDIIANALSSGVSGAVLGGVGGAFHSEKPKGVEPEIKPNQDVPADLNEALQTALQTPSPTELQTQQQQIRNTLTSTPAGYGPPGAGNQGEMFQPFEMGRQPAPGPGVAPTAQQGEMFPSPGAGVTQHQTEAFPPVEMGPPRPAPDAGMPDTAAQSEMFPGALGTKPGTETPAPSVAQELAEKMRSSEQLLQETRAAKAASDAARQAQPPIISPTSTTPVAEAAAEPRPSEGMKVQELRDALTTMPGQDPRAVKRMNREDLARTYDRAQAGAATSPEGQSTTGEKLTTVAKEAVPTRTGTASEPPPPTAVERSLPVETVGEAQTAATEKPVAEQAPSVAEPRQTPGKLIPTPAGEVPPQVQEVREQALEHLAAVRRQMKVPAGEATQRTNKAMADFQRAINNAKSLDDILVMLKTAREHGDPLSQRIAQRVETRLTGRISPRPVAPEPAPEGVSEVEQVAREERARGARTEAPSPEAIEETATGGGPGGETMGLPTVHEPVRKGTDLEAIGKSLLRKALDDSDPMDVHQAAERFGKQPPGPGRPRRATTKDFSKIVEAELKRVDNPERAEKLRDQLRQALIDERDAEPGEAKLSDRLEKALEDYAPERVQKLKDMLRELQDPVGKAADEQAPTREEMAQRMRDRIAQRKAERDETKPPMAPGVGIDPRSSRFVQVSRDVRLEHGLARMMQEAENNGRPLMAHDVARYITQDPLINTEAKPLALFARQLLRLMPNIPVMSREYAYEQGHISREVYDAHARGYGFTDLSELPGQRMGQAERIIVNINHPHLHGTHVGTFLHEAVHAVAAPLIEHLRRTDPNNPLLQAMRLIGHELTNHFYDQKSNLTKTEHDLLRYAISNTHELHTMAMQDPTVQGFMASVAPSAHFRSEMAKLGYLPGQAGRTVWRYFTDWVRKALGLNAPASASEHTLLDYVLHPTQQLAEAGARYNARLLPKDPVLRPPASEISWNLGNTIAHDIRDRADPPGWINAGKRALLAVTNRDAIVDRFKSILPSLEGWRTADENIAAESSRFGNKHGDTVQELSRRLIKADDRNAVENLMTDATLAEAQLGKGADNSHLTKPEQLATLRDLEARFNKLSANDRQIYQDYRDFYKTTHGEIRAAELEGLANAHMPDATQAQRDAFTTGVKTKAQLDKFLADPDNSNIAKAFGDSWPSYRGITRGLAQIHDRGFVQGDYFPLKRFGNYVVRYGDHMDPDKFGVEFFESLTKARARRAELVKQGRDDVYQVARRDDTQFGDMRPNPGIVQELADQMRRRGADAAQVAHATDNLRDILLRHATRSEAARAAQRRRGVKGASTDQVRVLANDFISNMQRIGYALHGGERVAQLQKMHNEMKQLEGPSGAEGAAVRAANVVHEMQKRMTRPEDHDNTLHKISRFATGFSFAQSLMSPSHMLTSTLETHTNSLAILGARHGYARTALVLSRALAQASPTLSGGARNTIKALGNRLKASDWNMVRAMVDHMAAKPGADKVGLHMLADELERAGMVDHTILQDIRQQMNPSGMVGTGVQKTWNWFTNSNAAMAHAVDVMNKLAVGKAAYDLELAKNGGDKRAAVNYAVQSVRRVMPNYTSGNRERIAMHPLMSPLLQFKRYGLHMYALMANLASEAAHGPNRAESAKALAGILATHAAMAGVITLVADPLRYIGGAYDLATGKPTFHNYQNDLRGFFADTFGPEAGELISRGLPHAVGIDLHRRVGLANLLEIPEMDGFNKDSAGKVLLGLTTGATGENLQNMVDGVAKLIHGDLPGAMNTALPRVFRDAMKGVTVATEGIKDRTGKVILPPEKVGVGGGIAQALGFQPSAVSEFREGRNAVLEAREEQRAEHSRLSQAWLAAAPEDRPAIMSQIRDFNAQPNNRGARITIDQLLRDQQAARKQSRAPFGLRLPAGSRLGQAGAFANY